MNGALRRWLALAAAGVAAAVAVAAVGVVFFAGEARTAFVAGTAASAAAALAGAVPLARAGAGREGVASIGKATALRFAVVVVAALVGVVGWGLEKGPLLVGLAASYVAVLAAETGFLVRRGGRAG